MAYHSEHKKPTWRLASLNFLWKPENLNARLDFLKEEIERIAPDVLCLQEISPAIEPAVLKTLESVFAYHTAATGGRDGKHWNITFSKTPLLHTQLALAEEKNNPGAIPTIVAATKIGDSSVHVLNGHFSWGAPNNALRLRQAEQVAAYAAGKNPDTTIVLAGDLNCTPDNRTIRFLTGLEEGHDGSGSFWIDAWDHCGTRPSFYTNEPALNTLAAETCIAHNLDPKKVPARRIDYIMTHGWKYGDTGSPSRFGRFVYLSDANGQFVSDHSGIWADIYR